MDYPINAQKQLGPPATSARGGDAGYLRPEVRTPAGWTRAVDHGRGVLLLAERALPGARVRLDSKN